MADLEKSVAIIFEGVDQMGAGVSSVTRQLDNVTGSVTKAAQPLADFTMTILKVEAAMLATGAAITGLAVKTAGEFDTAFREITTLLDLSGDSLSGLRGELLGYASTSTQAIGTVTAAYYNLISAGNDTEEAMELLAAAEQLAVGGKTDLDTASRALAGTLSAYGEDATQAAEYTDTLFVAMKNGMTTVDELASALPTITPIAAQLGIDFDTLAAAVSALTTTGLSTSQSVTQVGAALNSILGPSQQAKALAKELGIEFDATAVRSQGLESFLFDLAEATGGSESAMRTLFGSTEATKAVLGLTGAVADAFTGTLGNMEEKSGATAEAFEKMGDSIDLGSQRIKNAMTTALINLGDPLLDEFNGIQGAIAEIFNAIGISLSDGQLNQFVEQLESVFQGMEATLLEVARNLPAALESADWSGFLEGIEAIRNAVSQLFDGADLTTAEGLASIIGTLGTAFNMFAQYTAGTIAAIGPFIEKLSELAGWIMKIDPEWVALMGTLGGGAVVLTTVLSVFSSLLGIINNLAGAKGAIPAMTAATGKLTTALGTTGVGLVGSAAAAGFAIYQLYQEVQKFSDFRFNFSDELVEELDKTSGAQRATTELSLYGVQRIAEAYGSLSDWFGWGTEAAGDFKEVSAEAVAAAVDVAEFANAAESVDGAVDRASGAILDGFKAWEEWSRAAATARIQTEAADSALSTNADTLWDYIGSLEGAAVAWERVGDSTYQAVSQTKEIDAALAKVARQFETGMIDEETFNEMTKALSTMRDETGRAGGALVGLGEDAGSTKKELDLTTDQVFDLEKQLNELASNERIKVMEFSASIAVAEIEADARRIEAVLGSLNTTIDSTGQLLDGLYSDRFSGDLGRFDQLAIDSAIKRESEAREEALKLQREQVNAQIELTKAKTRALQDGEGMINISSDGLEPALEMIMWQIIEKVQVRANAEGAEFLLGLNG